MKVKKINLLMFTILLVPTVNAQWTGTAPGPIYYNSGNVGIGVTNPNAILDVSDYIYVTDNTGNARVFEGYREGTSNVGIVLRNDEGYWSFGRSQENHFVLSQNSLSLNQSTIFVATEAGDVGIGTKPTPNARLHVADQGAEVRFQHSTETGGFVIGDGSGDVTLATKVVNSGNVPYNAFVHLDHATSNVGIGHLTPSYKLEVAGSVKSNAGNGEGFILNSGNTNISGLLRQMSNDLSLNANGVEVMRIEDEGRVGIGAADPKSTFEINTYNSALRFYGTNGIDVNNISSNVYYEAGWKRDNAANGAASMRFLSDGAMTLNTIISGTTDYPEERLRVTAEGNVGIGTTSPYKELHVIGDIGTSKGFLFRRLDGSGTAGLAMSGTGTYIHVQGDGLIATTDNVQDLGISGLRFRNLRLGSNAIIDGAIGIGTSSMGSYKLAVEGKVGARSIKVTSATVWADYVFAPEYNLMSLPEVESYIQENNHLPNIPSAEEVEKNGFELEVMDAKLLEKIEELTLYIIEQDKEIEELKAQNSRIKNIESQLEELKKHISKEQQ